MSPEYRAALLAARARLGTLDTQIARLILLEVYAWADQLTRWLLDRPEDPNKTSVAASREVIYRTAVEMNGKIRKAILTRQDLAFTQTLELWEHAGRRIAERKDLPETAGILRPNLTLLATNRPGATTWRTLLQGHVTNAAGEADAIVRRAILEGVSPNDLARNLQRYVKGAESFQAAFRRLETQTGEAWKIDLRQIPQRERGQAQQMRTNAERIAVTELHAARSDAEVLHFLHDPLIVAIKWTLAPDRGSQVLPDICDCLAELDLYDLGPGVHPLHRVPPLPHPRDRCERNPVERPASQAGEPKPLPGRNGRNVVVPRAGHLTANARDRVLREFDRLMGLVDESAPKYAQAILAQRSIPSSGQPGAPV